MRSPFITMQIRGGDTQRLVRKLGEVSEDTMQEIAIAIATVIELQGFL